jgi:sec-independent protein translocase protein TatA
MFGLGVGELVFIGVLALVFVGPKKLPELAKGLGKGIREFQRAKDDLIDEIRRDDDSSKVDSHQKEIPAPPDSRK